MTADQQPERRRFERVPKRISVTLALKYEGWEFQQSACTVDLSRGGLRIRTEPALDERQVVYLFSDAGVLHPRYCRVIWVRAGRPEQQCETGLEFPPRLDAYAAALVILWSLIWRYNRRVFPTQRKRWDNSFMCRRCAETMEISPRRTLLRSETAMQFPVTGR